MERAVQHLEQYNTATTCYCGHSQRQMIANFSVDDPMERERGERRTSHLCRHVSVVPVQKIKG